MNELIEAESLLNTSDDAEINWEGNACDTLKLLKKKKKQNQQKKGGMLPMIIQWTL